MKEIDVLYDYLSKEYKDCDDFVTRKIESGGTIGYICYLRGSIQREYLSELIIKPLIENIQRFQFFNGAFDSIIQSAALYMPKNNEDIRNMLARGEVMIAIESDKLYVILANAQKGVSRGINEPTSDITVKGPKIGFIESADTNVSALRQYIRNADLKFVSVDLGTITQTKIYIAYIKGRAEINVVEDIMAKLKQVSATGIIDSSNVEMLLEDGKKCYFSQVGSTEKVDKVASKLLSGRVAIIVDGSPFVLTAPYVFGESLQSAEDYLRSPYYATFIRGLRLCAYIIALYLPGIFVALVNFHDKLLPEQFLNNIEKLRENVPIPLVAEVFMVLIIFEILREVGVRMPRTVGDAVGILGSIVIGNAAVEAGLASTFVILIVAFSAICAFIVPVYMYSTVLIRFIFLIVGAFTGIYGILLTTLIILAGLCGKESFGTPYMSPLAPYSPLGMEDFIYAVPGKVLGRAENLIKKQ